VTPSVLLTLGFATGVADAPAIGDTVLEQRGAFILIGTGCYLLPILAVLLGVIR
jgi:hypothetical protein